MKIPQPEKNFYKKCATNMQKHWKHEGFTQISKTRQKYGFSLLLINEILYILASAIRT